MGFNAPLSTNHCTVAPGTSLKEARQKRKKLKQKCVLIHQDHSNSSEGLSHIISPFPFDKSLFLKSIFLIHWLEMKAADTWDQG